MEKVTFIENKCPYCDYKSSAVIDSELEDVRPIEGDYSICLNCEGIAKFSHELKLNKVEQLEKIPLDDRLHLTKMILKIRRYKKMPRD